MLSRVIVKNFKSFKEETIFDYRKTNYKLLERNTCGKLLKGIGSKIFTIAGPVILYGIFSSWILGVIYWIGKCLGVV